MPRRYAEVARRMKVVCGAAALAGLIAAIAAFNPAPPAAVAKQPEAALPADLALVPADAVGFAHVRLADLWKNDLFYQLRKTWEAAGEKALRALDAQFVPAPSSISRVTGFLLLDPESKQPRPFGILAFSEPFDREQLVKLYLPDAKAREVNGKTVYNPRGNPDLAVVFRDDRHVILGMDQAMDGYLSKPVPRKGPLSGALKLAASRPVVAAADISAIPIPPQALNDAPTDVRPILKAKQLLIALDLGENAKLEVKATYPDAAAAQDAENAVRKLVEEGRKQLARQKQELEQKLYSPKAKTPRPPEQLPDAIGAVFGLGALNRLDGMLADPNLIAREGNDLAFNASMPKEVVALAGLFGTVGLFGMGFAAGDALKGVGDAFGGSNTQSQNNLKQIGIAIHSYHNVYNKFPEDIKDRNGKPILSWRVAILPFLEQENLYKQFKLDEPWDSQHNKPLSQTVVKVYESPHVKERNQVLKPGEKSYGLTDYLGVAGTGMMFDPQGKVRLQNVTDGTSNTVMVVETSNPVPWAKPEDLQIDPKKPLPKISAPGMDGVTNFLFADGSVRKIDTKKVPEKTLRAMFTRDGGEVYSLDD